MAEVLFYHLEHKPWAEVLPRLLTATLERGWRAVVQVGAQASVDTVSEVLWTSLPEDSFIAHGSAGDGREAEQPVWLTAGDDTPNGAQVRFFIEGAAIGELAGLKRAVILFDGADQAAVERARSDWKIFKSEGHDISYWQQDENLRWQNKSRAR
jgi:DNA polymerase-3 subunit chi